MPNFTENSQPYALHKVLHLMVIFKANSGYPIPIMMGKNHDIGS